MYTRKQRERERERERQRQRQREREKERNRERWEGCDETTHSKLESNTALKKLQCFLNWN